MEEGLYQRNRRDFCSCKEKISQCDIVNTRQLYRFDSHNSHNFQGSKTVLEYLKFLGRLWKCFKLIHHSHVERDEIFRSFFILLTIVLQLHIPWKEAETMWRKYRIRNISSEQQFSLFSFFFTWTERKREMWKVESYFHLQFLTACQHHGWEKSKEREIRSFCFLKKSKRKK